MTEITLDYYHRLLPYIITAIYGFLNIWLKPYIGGEANDRLLIVEHLCFSKLFSLICQGVRGDEP